MPKLIWYISHLILDINLWFNIVKLCVSAYSGHLDTGVFYTHMQNREEGHGGTKGGNQLLNLAFDFFFKYTLISPKCTYWTSF